MVSIQELTFQVVVLTCQAQSLINRLSVAEQNATRQKTQSGLGVRKRLYPKELKDSTAFRSWSERFVAWIDMDNGEIG